MSDVISQREIDELRMRTNCKSSTDYISITARELRGLLDIAERANVKQAWHGPPVRVARLRSAPAAGTEPSVHGPAVGGR